MFLVREVLYAKPGQAGKLAKLMKDVMPSFMGREVKVMLDFVTDFNKIVLEHEVESLAEFEKLMHEFKSNPEIKSKMTGYTEMYAGGKREIYKIVE